MSGKHKKILIISVFTLLLVSCGKEQPYDSVEEKILQKKSLDIIMESQGEEISSDKKNEYIREELEKRLQETIQLMYENVEPQISIQNLYAEDRTEVTASVTLYIGPDDEVSEDMQKAIKRLVSGSIDEISPENISIRMTHTKE